MMGVVGRLFMSLPKSLYKLSSLSVTISLLLAVLSSSH